MPVSAVFLDRDGTINEETHHLYRYKDWRWLPGSIDAIRALNEAGYLVIVVSNQGGVARGLYSASDVDQLHRQVDRELVMRGGRIDSYYYCPHHPRYGDSGECECRKPAPGLLRRAALRWDIELKQSFIVGDKATDVEAGINAGVTPIMVATGYGAEQRELVPSTTRYVADLLEAAQLITGIFRR